MSVSPSPDKPVAPLRRAVRKLAFYWEKCVTIGLRPSDTEREKKRIRLLNGIAMISLLIFLFFTLQYTQPGYQLTLLECLQMSVSMGIVLLLTSFRKFNFACHYFIIYNLVSFTFQAVSHGKGDAIEYILLDNGIAAMLFFRNIRVVVTYFLLNGIAFAFCKYSFTVMQPFLVMANHENFYIPNHVNLFFVSFLIVFYFKSENKRQETLLEDENMKLADTLEQLRATQEQLVRQEKLASLGQLTAGIAHEIQNPLNFVNNFSSLSHELMEELDEAENDEERSEIKASLKTNLEKIASHGRRAQNIVKSMMQLSRNETREKTLININSQVEESMSLANHFSPDSGENFQVNVIRQFAPALPGVYGVHEDINRVLINLFSNAFYAMKEKKEKLGASFQPEISVTTLLHHPNVLIRIRDNGPGIPTLIKEKVFNPFFTTKPSGKGTGLGLSISYDIIKLHGGEITVDSRENEFTEFVIELPAEV